MCGWNCRGGSDNTKKPRLLLTFRATAGAYVISKLNFRPCGSCVSILFQRRGRRTSNISIKRCIGSFLIRIQEQRANKRRDAARDKPQQNCNITADYSLAGQDCQCNQRRRSAKLSPTDKAEAQAEQAPLISVHYTPRFGNCFCCCHAGIFS